MTPIQHTTDRDPYLWKQAKARVGFRMHLRSYLIINAGLWLIWAVSSFASGPSVHGVFPWPVFVIISWGIGLVSHYVHVYRGSDERPKIEEEYQKLVNQRGY